MTDVRNRAEEAIRSCPEWYHSIELAPGITTPGRQPAEVWQRNLVDLQLPDLTNKSVLDIGAYDGFFSFAAERLKAARVTALDHYVWSADMAEYMKEWRESRRVARVTALGGLAVIETEAMEIPGQQDAAFCEFFPGQELNNDSSNWWVPYAKALEGLCRAAGFREVTVLTELPWRPLRTRLSAAIKHLVAETHIPKKFGYREETRPSVQRYRATAHARL